MTFLSGKELVEFIKPRQAKSIRGLIQAENIIPQLAIITTTDDPVINTYIKLKQAYADEIGAMTKLYQIEQTKVATLIKKLEETPQIHGIIIQLPLKKPDETEKLCQLIPLEKDIDGLNPASNYDSATVTAINWLLAGYGIDLVNKRIVIVGQGKLIGQPLSNLWQLADLNIEAMDKHSLCFETIKQADIIVTATGQPGSLKAIHFKDKAVVIDAGSASVDGRLIGDIDPNIYETRDDLKITPQKGGVGPLTIAVLFENLITASRRNID